MSVNNALHESCITMDPEANVIIIYNQQTGRSAVEDVNELFEDFRTFVSNGNIFLVNLALAEAPEKHSLQGRKGSIVSKLVS